MSLYIYCLGLFLAIAWLTFTAALPLLLRPVRWALFSGMSVPLVLVSLVLAKLLADIRELLI